MPHPQPRLTLDSRGILKLRTRFRGSGMDYFLPRALRPRLRPPCFFAIEPSPFPGVLQKKGPPERADAPLSPVGLPDPASIRLRCRQEESRTFA